MPGHGAFSCHDSPAGTAAGDLRVRRNAANAAMARKTSTSTAYRISRPLPRGGTGTGGMAAAPPPKCVATFTPRPVLTSRVKAAALVSAAAALTVPNPTRSSYPCGGGFWAVEVMAWSTSAGERWG